VFREWARDWAKRVIVKNAIRVLNPHRSGPIGHFHVDAVLRLADFERFVFVMRVLEHYREYECALLLGCSGSEVREARTQAIAELAESCPSSSNRYEDRERSGWAEALKA